MKRTTIYVLVVLAIGIISSNLLTGSPQGKGKDDNWGKLVGVIVDPETDKPVNEVFIVAILECREDLSRILIERWPTDKKGYLSIELRPYQYCLSFAPESRTSKYSFEPYPFLNNDYYFPVVIEKGKITKFKKKATIAGRLKVKLVDPKGRQINPQLEFKEGSRILISSESANITYPYNSGFSSNDIGSDGEMIVYSLYPDTYTIEVDFQGTGFGFPRIKKDNIEIKSGEMTEIKLVINPTDITGVQGRVCDKNGVILKKGKIIFIPQSRKIAGDFSCITDENGDYQLTGMVEGIYEIMISVNIGNNGFGSMWTQECIEIKKGAVLKKDIIMKYSIEELENE